jgi:hypothetical protein
MGQWETLSGVCTGTWAITVARARSLSSLINLDRGPIRMVDGAMPAGHPLAPRIGMRTVSDVMPRRQA